MDKWTWETLIDIVIIVAVMLVAWLIAVRATRRLVTVALHRREENRNVEGQGGNAFLRKALDNPRQVQRTRTLGSMLTSVAGFLIVLVGTLMILSTLGLPMGPLLTSAGIGGVAIGFGAQTLIKDFLSGVFLIAEDQFGVGDVVDVGEVTGTVEEVGLRVTKLRDANGQVWYVRNGEIIRVGNISQGWSNALVDIPVDYTADSTQVIELVQQACDAVNADPEYQEMLLEAPQVLGVESIQGTTMTIRVLAKCVANKQWGVQREIRERAKVALDAAGVPGPRLPWGGAAKH